MKQTLSSLFLICIIITLSGCWEDMEGWNGSAAWSDDDTDIVAVYEYFKGQKTVSTTKKKDIESELYLMPFDGLRDEALRITMKSPGRINDLFYMKSANYLIVNREQRLTNLDQDMNKMSHFYVDKVSLNGTVNSLGSRQALTMISCDAQGRSATTTGEVISGFPSPDAETIALVETNTSCQDKTVSISFLSAQTLEQIGDSFVDNTTVNGQLVPTDYAWLENGRFAKVSASFQGPVGFTYAPNTMPEPLEGLAYDCFFPASNSSDINENGVYVSISEGEIQLSAPDPLANTFGCPNP